MSIIEITSLEAWDYLYYNHQSILVDVRSVKEWSCDGVPKIDSFMKNKLIKLSIGNCSIDFINQLVSEVICKDIELFFLCKSGIRSKIAAILAESIGYRYCYNIKDGFIGNDYGCGWKLNNLPWQI